MNSLAPPLLIGLTGTNGAGKGEAAAYFMTKGYAYFSLSDVIRDKLEKLAGFADAVAVSIDASHHVKELESGAPPRTAA